MPSAKKGIITKKQIVPRVTISRALRASSRASSMATKNAVMLKTVKPTPFSQFIPYSEYNYEEDTTREEHALEIATMIKDIVESNRPSTLSRTPTMVCDQKNKPACVMFAVARYLSNIISTKLIVLNTTDRDNIHYLVYSFCEVLSEDIDLDKNIGYAYTLLMDAYNSLPTTIKLDDIVFQNEDELILPSMNGTEIGILRDKLIYIQSNYPGLQVTHQGGPRLQFNFRDLRINYLLIFIALPIDIIYDFAKLCDDSKATDAEKQAAYAKLSATSNYPPLRIEQNSYKDKKGKTTYTYKFKDTRTNEDVPGHALLIVGFEIDAAGNIIIYVRGSWGGCDKNEGYIKVPWNFILYYLYSYTSAEAAGFKRKRQPKTNKKKPKSPKKGTRKRK
jgi:hypothetical protein